MATSKKFIRITSTKTIRVTPGLQNVNVSNAHANISERLRVNSYWQGSTVMIKVGTGFYPAIIATWNSVKSLVESGILTLGEQTDDCTDETAIKDYERLKLNAERLKGARKEAKEDILTTGADKGATVKPTVEENL